MTKQELRVGYQVVLRNGETSVVKCDGAADPSLPFVKGFTVGDYRDDLVHLRFPDFDIVEAYGWPDSLPKANRLALYYKKYRKLLWRSEDTHRAAKTDVPVKAGDAEAYVTVEDRRLVLQADVDGQAFRLDLCRCGSDDELITGGERIDYEVFRALSIEADGDGFVLTVHTENGNAVYRRDENDVTAEASRKVYTCFLCKDGLCLR